MKKVDIDTNMEQQVFEGWGTALTWWANVIGNWKSETKINELCDLIFDRKKGLGLNIVRYNFGGGSNPPNSQYLRTGANMPSYCEAEDKWDMDADEGQRKILLKSIERGVDVKEAFFNTPPIWMLNTPSTAGRYDGGENLKETCYDEFIDYTVELLKRLEQVYNLRFETLSFFNEPSSVWWRGDNNQEGCHYSTESQSILLEKMAQKLNEIYPIILSGPEGWSTAETIAMYLDYSENAKKILGQINTHAYFTEDRMREWLRDIAKEHNKKLWMSEVCLATSGAHDHDGCETGLMIARSIIKDMKLLQPHAWIYWQVIEDELLNHNYGFLHANFRGEEEYFITKSYYYFAQFTKYIRPGSRLIQVDDEDIIASGEDNRINLVILNDTQQEKVYQINMPVQIEGGRAIYTDSVYNLEDTSIQIEDGCRIKVAVPIQSVMTLVIKRV